MLHHFIFLQQSVEQIKEKIESAPDKGYEIGVAIGAFLPFLMLMAIAFLIYLIAKKRNNFND